MNPTLSALCLAVVIGAVGTARAEDPTCWVYFGTQATHADRGLYVAELNQATGSLSAAHRVADKSNSVFMAFSPDQSHLYALAEVSRFGGRPVEAIESYSTDRATGRLTSIGEQVSGGSEACHLSMDPKGGYVFAANYDGAYVEAFPVLADGTVGPRSCVVNHSGSGPNHSRQQSAHPHSINMDPSGTFAIVADLGQDKVFVYRLDRSTGTLKPNNPPYATVPPGAGPRHFAFHPDGRHAFVINELEGSITAFNWDAGRGILTPYETVPILRRDYTGLNTAAEVVVGKSGRFVYGSNRGDDSIVVHAFDSQTGKLTFVQRMGDGIKVPRNYAIDPSGNWLVCANLTASSASVFHVDAATGMLKLMGTIQVPEPLCVRFLQR